MLEWIRFGFCALFVIVALVCFVSEVLGVSRWKSMLCRIHAAAVGDTLGLMAAVLAAVIARGVSYASAKMLFVFLFMLVSAPVSGHVLARIESLAGGADRGRIHMEIEHAPGDDREEESASLVGNADAPTETASHREGETL